MKLKKVMSMAMAAAMVLGMTATAEASEGTEASAETAAEATEAAGENASQTVSPLDLLAPEVDETEAVFRVCTYYGGDNTVFADYAAEKIKEKYPNVTLEFETYPSDGGQTIKTRAATGDLPEILMVDSGTISVLAESGSIIPLDEYIEKFRLADYYNDSIMQNTLYAPDGHMYHFQIGSISPILWYYNNELFEENNIKVPENYDELLAAVKAFREKDIIPMAMFGKEPWPLGAFFDSFAVKEVPGGCYALSKGEVKASDEGIQKAVGKIEELIQAGIFQDGVTNTDFDTASALFKEGKAAMMLNGSWYTGDVIEPMAGKVDIMAAYPTADAGSEAVNEFCMTGGGDTNGMAVTASAKAPELSAKIAFLFGYYREAAQYQAKGLVTTPLKSDDLTLDNELDPISQKLLGVVNEYTYDTKFLHTLPNTKFATIFTEEMQKFLVGESAADFTANLDKAIEKTVEK
ncbi:ABC transporter substrate-binding protein [Murimonas intestini]|uniref:ABC transporter substrate-binding protein n=1 Tax=Murimonas intestini TaxID=1337051 RepID=UPI0011DC7494|nr:extracellular solute-binding protein [Murimonas intestini]